MFTKLIFAHWCCAVSFKATQTKSVILRTLKFRQYQHETHKEKKKKPQGAVTLRNDAILIFKLLNFCCSKSENRTLVLSITKPFRQNFQGIGCCNFVSTNTGHLQTKRKKRRVLQLSGMM
jgi:hypothetical protein